MSTTRILLLDHSTRMSTQLRDTLSGQGFDVALTEDFDDALIGLRAGDFEVVLGEMSLGGDSLLREALSLPGGPPVILFDDFATEEEALESVRLGAFHTLIRPVPDEQVLLQVKRALDHQHLRVENARLRGLEGADDVSGLISRDERMQRIFATVDVIADSRATVLLQGESGTGKTVLARAIHERSNRAERPFVVVNCGALPHQLLESELFGHARGSFTGAVRDREGKFEAADGGTIFLDEIATASPEMQVKLLRVLEDGRFERVGETTTRNVDVRVLAACNVDLEAEVEAGRFRRDLFYRIHVIGIDLPPLRERPGDVALLARRFLERFNLLHGRTLRGFEPAALGWLTSHPFPGNVRELENTVERGVLLCAGDLVRPEDLGAGPDVASSGAAPCPWDELPLGPLKQALEIPERWLIERALRHCAGRRQDAARILGINRTTLFNKMRKYNLATPPVLDEGGASEAPPRES